MPPRAETRPDAPRPATPRPVATPSVGLAQRPLRTLEHVLHAEPAVVRGFARAAADRLADGPLTLDARSRLLARGERLGLGRFDANLVLAAVEYRHREAGGTMRLAGNAPAGPTPAAAGSAARPSRWPAAAAAVALQGVILTGMWWLLA